MKTLNDFVISRVDNTNKMNFVDIEHNQQKQIHTTHSKEIFDLSEETIVNFLLDVCEVESENVVDASTDLFSLTMQSGVILITPTNQIVNESIQTIHNNLATIDLVLESTILTNSYIVMHMSESKIFPFGILSPFIICKNYNNYLLNWTNQSFKYVRTTKKFN